MIARGFEDFPDDAKLWVYAFAIPLDEGDQRIVSERLRSFVAGWNSHKIPVRGAFSIIEDRFVIVAGVSADGISGCSIDGSVDNFKFFREAYGLDGLNRDLVFFRNEDGNVEALDRTSFKGAVSSGRVGPKTVVFDTTIHSVGDLRAGKFETTFAQSWHAKAFPAARTRR
jgi:hypothetical protein